MYFLLFVIILHIYILDLTFALSQNQTTRYYLVTFLITLNYNLDDLTNHKLSTYTLQHERPRT